jgi:hypothetical protein
MASDEHTTMWWLGVGVVGVILADTPSQPVNSTKSIPKIKRDFEFGRFGVQKTSKNETAGEPHNRTSDLESPSRELSNEHLRGVI